LMPLVLSDPSRAEPAAKLITFSKLVPPEVAVELIGVSPIPWTVTPAPALVLVIDIA